MLYIPKCFITLSSCSTSCRALSTFKISTHHGDHSQKALSILPAAQWSTGIQQIARGVQYFKRHYARLFALRGVTVIEMTASIYKYQGSSYFHCSWSWSRTRKQMSNSHCRQKDKTSPGSQKHQISSKNLI